MGEVLVVQSAGVSGHAGGEADAAVARRHFDQGGEALPRAVRHGGAGCLGARQVLSLEHYEDLSQLGQDEPASE